MLDFSKKELMSKENKMTNIRKNINKKSKYYENSLLKTKILFL